MIAEIVDLERYPLDAALVEECRAELRREGAVKLEGFVRPEAVARMVADANRLAASGYPNDAAHNAYFDDEIDESLPDDHPRRILVRSAQKAVAMDLLPTTSRRDPSTSRRTSLRLSPPSSSGTSSTARTIRSTAAT